MMVSLIEEGRVIKQSEYYPTGVIQVMQDIPPGQYEVRAEAEGAKTTVKRGIRVNPGQQTELQIQMTEGQGVRVIEYGSGGMSWEELAARLEKLEATVAELQQRLASLRVDEAAAKSPTPHRTEAKGTKSPTAHRQAIAVPAYFYPAGGNLDYWKQMQTDSSAVSFAVATGLGLEGNKPDGSYQEQFRKTRAAGIKMLAYVTTSSSKKPLETLKREIDNAYAWYEPDGIFFDESVSYPVTCDQVGYHKELDKYVKAKGGAGLTVINHGQILPECYEPVADVMMNAETDYASYKEGWKPWGWEEKHPAKKFWHAVYGVDTPEKLKEIIELTRKRNAGYVYITPATSAMGQYGSLPPQPYWDRLQQGVTGTPTTVRMK